MKYIQLILIFILPISCSNNEKSNEKSNNIKVNRLNTAKHYIADGKFMEAYVYLEDYNKDYPNDPRSYYMQGKALEHLGQIDTALKLYNKSISIDSTSARYFSDRGSVLFDLKDYKMAIKDFKMAIRLDSNKVEAYNNLALSLAHLDSLKIALEFFDMAIQIDSTDSKIIINKAMTLVYDQEFKEAIETINYALKLEDDSKRGYAYLYRGIAYLELGKVNKACTDFQSAIAMNVKEAREYMEYCI